MPRNHWLSTTCLTKPGIRSRARAADAFNDAVGSYERMVRPSGDRLVKLSGGGAEKDLVEVPPLDANLRLTSGS